MRNQTRTEDEDDELVHGVARDGEIVRVPVMLMDSIQRSVAADALAKPAAPTRTMALSDAERQRRADMYSTADKALTERWRDPPSLATTQAATDTKPTGSAYDRYDAAIQERWRGAA